MRHRYSHRGQESAGPFLDAEELIDDLADDLLTDGDIEAALQRALRWGVKGEGQGSPGLQDLLQQLRRQRQEELERYSLDSVMKDVQQELESLVQDERAAIERRAESAAEAGSAELRTMVEAVTTRKRSFLDRLPTTAADRINELADYEFLDPGARAALDGLLKRVKDEVVKSHFQSMQRSLTDMVGTDLSDLKTMMRSLNALLRDHPQGASPEFDRFMEIHGHYFDGAPTLQRLVDQLQAQTAYMEALVASMSADMRGELEQTLRAVMRDGELLNELDALGETLRTFPATSRSADCYPFSGMTSVSLEEALNLIKRMLDLDQLECSLKRALENASLSDLDSAQVGRLMGAAALATVEYLASLSDVLVRSGYASKSGAGLRLTPRGIRRIGHKALEDIFRHLKRDSFGAHHRPTPGHSADRLEETRIHQFGDPFLLDMTRTVMNAVRREGTGVPLSLQVEDFEVARTEEQVRSSTVLMLDMSRSMPLRGCFVAAKKVAFALNSLIKTQYPRDDLYIVAFSDYARVIRPESLHDVRWSDYVYGTNMQHGFMLARRLLAKRRSANKQVIVITDGEPTAHFEGDRVHFSYPPTYRTFEETLREVARCTRDGIVINTFMLERSHYLAEFVDQLTRINRGRAFFATPERLGDYVLVDYVASRRAR